MIKTIIGILLILAVASCGGDGPASNEINQFYIDLMKDKIVNLDRWLGDENNVCLGFDADAAKKAVSDLSVAGATEVYFCDINKLGDSNVALFICFKLPKDQSRREAIRKILNGFLSHKYEEYYQKDSFDGFEYFGVTKDT